MPAAERVGTRPAELPDAEVHVPLALLQQTGLPGQVVRIARDPRDLGVEGAIPLNDRGKIALPGRGVMRLLQAVERGDVMRSAPARGHPAGHAIEQLHRVEMPLQRVKVDRRHGRRTVRKRRDEPVAGKTDQRFADGRAGHAEAARQVRLVEYRAGSEVERKDFALQRLVDGGRARPSSHATVLPAAAGAMLPHHAPCRSLAPLDHLHLVSPMALPTTSPERADLTNS